MNNKQSLSRTHLLPIMAALATVGLASQAQAAPGEVLILDSTVAGGLGSPEAVQVSNLGFTPVLVNAATWAGMTTPDFADYEAIVLGDPNCIGGTGPISAAEANAATWAAAVDGNVLIAGTDPTWHINFGADPGAQVLNDNALAFALAEAGTGATGAYITLSCYYHSSANTPVPALSGFGGFTLRGAGATGALNNVHVVAAHPALAGLTDADLSNWGNSVHEHFIAWPGDFEVLAIAVAGGGTYTAGDGTVGYPYILARGVIPDQCGDGDVDPGEECDDGNNADGDGCDAACNVEACPDGDGDTVCDDDDVCPGSDDTLDEDADGVPDGCDICPAGDDGADADADGVPDACDICPGGDDSADADGDGLPDACDECPDDPDNDADGDGICGDVDLCADTMLPEGVPTVSLGVNRFADIDGDGIFETRLPNGVGPKREYTLEDTAGCSCEQIIDALGLGQGHTKFGCSISAMDDWVDMVSGDAAALEASDDVDALQLTTEDEAELTAAPQAAGCSVGQRIGTGAGWGLLSLLLVALGRRRRGPSA